MGHSVSDAAAASVKKSEKKEAKKNRTDAEIFDGIDKLLHDGLSVPPLDIRLLLTRYNELLEQALISKTQDAIAALEGKNLAPDYAELTPWSEHPWAKEVAEELGKSAGDYRNFVHPSDLPTVDPNLKTDPLEEIEKYQKAAEEDSGKDEMVSEGGPNG
jgi:hypothetical protein